VLRRLARRAPSGQVVAAAVLAAVGAGVVQGAGEATAAGLAAVPTWTMPAAAHSFSDSTRNPASAAS
jgi:hypothetical protein